MTGKGIPSIVGRSPEQFVALLKSHKSTEWSSLAMQGIAVLTSEDEMKTLAAYYAALKPVR